LRDAGIVGSSSKSVDQNSSSLGLRTLSGFQGQKETEMVCSLGPVIKHLQSPSISNSVGNLSSQLHEEGSNSSISRYLKYLCMFKCLWKRVYGL
jgi:hypothetical protein